MPTHMRGQTGDGTSEAVERLEGDAPAIATLREQIRRLASFDAVGGTMVPTVLIGGETGTGKGLVARIVHDTGPRARGPFVPVNCAAIPDTMLEAELFGHEPGAFTDARRAKPGLFEAAEGGTLFLDEIDSLALPLQSKLLTAIESKRVRRLGAVTERPVDVKLLAASPRDLAGLAAEGRFREDLYHRLAVVVLALPPLRARGDDVVLLARTLLERFASGYGTRPKTLARDAADWLRAQAWPGNVRELSHLMERVTLLHADASVDARGLARLAPPQAGLDPHERPTDTIASTPDDAASIRDALARTGGNVVGAARLLGVSRDTLRYRMRRHGIERPDLGDARQTALPVAPATPAAPDRASTRPAPPGWEQKAVALVAASLTWPERGDGAVRAHEPWTEHQRWAGLVRDKLSGLGGVALQESPGLSLWAFGVPRALDQAIERAVHGALAVRQLAAGATAREQVPEIRVAVHQGSMLVDASAADPVAGTLPRGDAATLPLRLLGEADPGEVVATAEVARRVQPWARVEVFTPRARALAARSPSAYRIAGLRPWHERESSRRRLTPFVGRERELGALRALVSAATAGTGQVAGIVGAPGAGKSRLVRELRRGLDGSGVRYAETHGLAHGSLTPLLPFIALVRAYLDVSEGESAEGAAAKTREALAALGLDPEPDVPHLLALLGFAGPAPSDGDAFKRRTFDLFRRLLLALSRQTPYVLVVENVHWIDPTTEECCAYLADAIADAPILLAMTYRPGYRPAWLDKSYATQIALTPLGAAESRRLVDAVADGQALPAPLAEQILARAEGNPLFLEELTRSVIDPAQPVGDSHIPDTIHAVIAARIDRLAEDDKRLLHAAAVIGREVPYAVLERVAGAEDAALHAGLARLEAGEFLVERGGRAERTYGFKHALTQAAAYQDLPAVSRGALHLRVLDAMEALAGEWRAERLPEMAQHAAAGGDWRRAAAHYREAGLRVLARDANREAARCLEEALHAAERLGGDDMEVIGLACDIRFELMEALYRTGSVERATATAREAHELAEKLGDPGRLSHVLAGLTHLLSNEARYEEAMEAGVRGLAIADDHGIVMMGIWSRIILGRACLALGRFEPAIAYLRAALAAIGEDGDRRYALRGVVPPSPQARTYLALCLSRTGGLAEAVEQAEAAVRVADDHGGLMDRAWAYYALGRAHHARTDWAQAIPWLERAAALCDTEGFVAYVPRILSGLASAYAQSGQNEMAVPLLERALAAARTIRLAYGETLIISQLGTTCVAAGRVAEAAEHAARALALARQRGERGEEAWGLLLHGDVAAHREPAEVDEARTWYAEALALGESLGMRPLIVRCRLAMGELERRAGRPETARTHYEQAAAGAEAMGIHAWLARARERLV
jgi:DNA-binding NtrC family response regulator/tetratricopeptide (TPR) repeat protein